MLTGFYGKARPRAGLGGTACPGITSSLKMIDMDFIAKDDPELAEVFADLQVREPIFHRPEFGTTRTDFERMTEEDFREIGASGRQYSRAFVLEELEKRHASQHEDVWETYDFRCQRLVADLYLLTYTLLQDKTRLTRRSTIWHKTAQGWKIVFHQGTIVE